MPQNNIAGTDVTVNYASKAAIKLFKEFNFHSMSARQEDLPLTKEGKKQQTHTVFEKELIGISNADVSVLLKNEELALCDILTILSYVKKMPNRQFQYQLVILFTGNDSVTYYLWFGKLSRMPLVIPIAEIGNAFPDDTWDDPAVRFLVTRIER